jgi:lipoate-protein ligase A
MVGARSAMRLLDLTLDRVDVDLAQDEALFRALEDAGRAGIDTAPYETLRFWEAAGLAVVVGRGGRIEEEVDARACAAAGVPVHRRVTGGGAVLLGPGCLCFSLVLSYERWPPLRNVAAGHRLIVGSLAHALGVPGLVVRGDSDLALGDRKVSGSAQLRGRHGVLHHGTLLHAFAPQVLCRFLSEPRRRPSYRGRRRHADFVANLPLSVPEMKSRLAAAWKAEAV